MSILSAFSDEISQEFSEQLAVLKECKIRNIDLRSAWHTNVMQMSEPQLKDIEKRSDDAGVSIASIGSPIGKSKIDQPAQFEMDRVKHATDVAEFFGCGFIRIFSFYPPEGKNIADYGKEVVARMRQWTDFLEKEKRPVVLTSENESKIFGDIPERNVELMENLFGPKMINCYDPANFINIGLTDIYNKCYLPLKKYTKAFHLKDCVKGMEIVPCGEGSGEVEKTLADAHKSGFDGFMTLEPHLRHAAQFAGFSGPDLFIKAVKAVKNICERQSIPLK